jgi:uncharacterized protein YutE (UPF0331/DUF86 family)
MPISGGSREASLVDLTVLGSKRVELQDRIARIRETCPATAEMLENDRDALDLTAFYLMLAMQSCLDIASHLISDEDWQPATTLAGSFQCLAQQGALSAETAAALGKAVGLRNLIAHGYGGIEPELIHVAATRGIDDLERFAREIDTWVRSR